jgi:hypothetical protein
MSLESRDVCSIGGERAMYISFFCPTVNVSSDNSIPDTCSHIRRIVRSRWSSCCSYPGYCPALIRAYAECRESAYTMRSSSLTRPNSQVERLRCQRKGHCIQPRPCVGHLHQTMSKTWEFFPVLSSSTTCRPGADRWKSWYRYTRILRTKIPGSDCPRQNLGHRLRRPHSYPQAREDLLCDISWDAQLSQWPDA